MGYGVPGVSDRGSRTVGNGDTVSEHLPAFIAGALLHQLVDALDLDLEPASFDGDDDHATFVVVGRAGTRVRVTVALEGVALEVES